MGWGHTGSLTAEEGVGVNSKDRLKRDLKFVLTRGKLVWAERKIKEALKMIRLAYKELQP